MGWRSFLLTCTIFASCVACLLATSLRHHPINERQAESLKKKYAGMSQEESDAANEFDSARLNILNRHREQKLKAKKQRIATKEVFGLVNNEAKEHEVASKLKKLGIGSM